MTVEKGAKAPQMNGWEEALYPGPSLRQRGAQGRTAAPPRLDVAALAAARAATAEGAVQRKVDVLLAVDAHHERRHVHDLLPDAADRGEAVMSAHAKLRSEGGRAALGVPPRARRMWRWRMSTRAWWMDLARPSLKTRVCSRRSRKASVFSDST